MGGACLMKRVKVQMAGKRGSQFCVVISLITVASSFIWAVPGCQNTNLAGIIAPYHNRSVFHGHHENNVASDRTHHKISLDDGNAAIFLRKTCITKLQ